MKDLSPDARAMLDAVRKAHMPNESDRERVRTALAGRLAAPAAAALSARAALAPSKAIVAKAAIAKTLVALVITGSVAASVFSATRAPQTRASQPALHATHGIATPRHEPGAPHVVVPEPAARPWSPEPMRSEPHAVANTRLAVPYARATTARLHAISAAPPSAALPRVEIGIAASESPSTANTLGAELALVRGAQDALRDHDATAALTLLDRHAAQFPFGVLREERSAARVLALCALDRIDAARDEAARLLRSAPSSPQVARVRASCAGERAAASP
jgi:hypothetical protein